MIQTYRKFKLSDQFVEQYKGKQPKWGPLGYVVYKRTYARTKQGGGTEEFWETVQRVVEGAFNLQKKHCSMLGLEWNNAKAQKTAQEMYDAIWNFKFIPSGRNLWQQGTDYVENRTGMGLFNCSFVSTQEIDRLGARPFMFMMDGLMLGVGMGFDTKGENKILLKKPAQSDATFIIADSREGWVESVGIILNGYFFGTTIPKFDYSAIRKEGLPLKGFGGISSGPKPLVQLHKDLINLLDGREGEYITSTDIVDIENYISRCVIAGSIRRSAAIALGRPEDADFLKLKHDKKKLSSHRYGSNNSILAKVGMDYSAAVANTRKQGEPGYVWLDNMRTYGRFKDGTRHDDLNVAGVNPCGEQQLESYEACMLVETFPANATSLDDYLNTLKLAYLYGKSVTLANTHWPETNAIMLKNRRIGLSQSGIQQARVKLGTHELLRWCDLGYKYIQELDAKYSDWLCVPRSKRTTSIKPSGTVSLLVGATPGIHYPENEYYIRRIRFEKASPMLAVLAEAGYHIEEDKYNSNSMVVEFPVKEVFFGKTKKEATLWEQLEFAAQYQYYWSDNAVSVTVTFKQEEAADILPALELYQTRLKGVSFLPLTEHGYEQAPYEAITKEEYDKRAAKIKTNIDLSVRQGDALGEKYCDGDSCSI